MGVSSNGSRTCSTIEQIRKTTFGIVKRTPQKTIVKKYKYNNNKKRKCFDKNVFEWFSNITNLSIEWIPITRMYCKRFIWSCLQSIIFIFLWILFFFFKFYPTSHFIIIIFVVVIIGESFVKHSESSLCCEACASGRRRGGTRVHHRAASAAARSTWQHCRVSCCTQRQQSSLDCYGIHRTHFYSIDGTFETIIFRTRNCIYHTWNSQGINTQCCWFFNLFLKLILNI